MRKFKQSHMEAQFEKLPEILKEICRTFESLCAELGKESVITRVADRVEGESGVHPLYRAVDYRDETSDGADLFTDEETAYIVERINRKYRRTDGKLVCIHHSFKGMPRHFHLQVPAEERALYVDHEISQSH